MRLCYAFVCVITVALLCGSALGQSAIGQLEQMTGQKIDRFEGGSAYGHGTSKTNSGLTQDRQIADILGGLLGQMLTKALEPPKGGMSAAQVAQAQKLQQEAVERQQQQLHAWAASYSQQMNRLLSDQRQRRSKEDEESLENLSAALSSPWDGGPGVSPSGGLASALSDPAPVVDLSGSKTFTPSLLRAENGAPRSAKVTPDEVLKRRAEAQARLKAMMEEDKDLKRLGQRFYELESRLSYLKRSAACLGSQGRNIAGDFDAWGLQVDGAVQNSIERGVSLVTGTLIPESTAEGLKTLHENPKTWNSTLEAISQINDFVDFVNEMGDRYDFGRQTIDWVKAKRNLYKDMDFIASNLGNVSKAWKPLTMQWELGKNIIGSGLDVAQELDAWGNMNEAEGDLTLLKVRQQALQARMSELVHALQASRAVLASRLEVNPEDLILSDASRIPPPPCAGR